MTSSIQQNSHGTAWRIWDLHVHTPASVEQGYGGNTDEVWDRYLNELEALPSEISVIGINDYWFLDGYERVLAARNAGRLQNLEAIFPVIEMRIDQFGGTDGDLSRVNLHVIFDPELTPEVIQAQFINALQPKFKLEPGSGSAQWQGVITREALAAYGAEIKKTVPVEQLKNYGSDFQEGFNNLNVSLSDVQEVLNGSFLRNRFLIGIGKTEWSDIKWNQQSIGNKKHLINSSNFVFTAYKDTSRWKKDVELLRASSVTHKILDCSDAHYFSDSKESMRLGACQTWMNTTPTLAGLAYAIEEFDRRVYVGLEPPTLGRIRRNPERFIDRIRVTSNTEPNGIFDHDIPLNPGFVAIVGNKGQGKSALLDCIALSGNSSRKAEFAFLQRSRFLSPANIKLARQYSSEVTWVDGSTRTVALDAEHDGGVPTLVEYLPQAYVERVCNSGEPLAGSDEFERELRTILFTHIPEDERAGANTFDALQELKTRKHNDGLLRLREELRTSIQNYVELYTLKTNQPIDDVKNRLTRKQSEVAEAEKAVSDAKAELERLDEASLNSGDVNETMNRAAAIEEALAGLKREHSEIDSATAEHRRKLSAMEAISHKAAAIQRDVRDLNRDAELVMGSTDTPYAKMTIENSRFELWRTSEKSSLGELAKRQRVLDQEIAESARAKGSVAEELASIDSERERARQRILQSEERVRSLRGSESDDESELGLTSLLVILEGIPARLGEARSTMLDTSKLIYSTLADQLSDMEGLYSHASTFIRNSTIVKNAGLKFNAELKILPSWRSVSAGLDGRRNGDFIDWLVDLPQRIEDMSWEHLEPELAEALLRLERDRGDVESPERNPATALRTTTNLNDFLRELFDLSWLEVKFGLTGEGLPLSRLSPGQRGLVLALFYLVVDRRRSPLLLDQPEENLDNETIASKLVPAIHDASGRRQTIVVTHNANLAIVGDADQVIHCQMIDRKFVTSSGSIADIKVAKFSLDVLEGTKPAFDNRRHKYEAFPELN